MLRDTNVPFRGKLYYSSPIQDFDLTINLIKSASIGLNLDSNIAKKVWAYDAKTFVKLLMNETTYIYILKT
jgi:hypothetical protein